MKHWLLGAAVVLGLLSPAKAQDVYVVQSCGTLPQQYPVGSTQKPTVDINGRLCFNTSSLVGPLGINYNINFGNPGSGNSVANSLITATGNAAGICTSSPTCWVGRYAILGDSIDASAASNGLFTFELFSQSAAGMKGARGGLHVWEEVTQAPGDTGRNYTGILTEAIGGVNVGGSGGSEAGGLWGHVTRSILRSAATSWLSNIGFELDYANQSSTVPKYGIIYSAVLENDNASAPTNSLIGYALTAQSGATATVTCGFCIGDPQGVNPLATTATVLKWAGSGTAPTVTGGIDLTGFASITGDAYASSGFHVTGAGALSLGSSNHPTTGYQFATSGFTAWTVESGGSGNNWMGISANNSSQPTVGWDSSHDLAFGTVTSNAWAGFTPKYFMQRSGMFSFAGQTSSFPGLKRSGSTTTLAVRLADDSADAPITAAGATLSGQLTVTAMTQTSAAQSGTVCYNSGTGAVTYDATVGCLTSAMRFKTNIETIAPREALDEVLRMRPVAFDYNSPELPRGRQVGLIADEVAQIDERLVGRTPDGEVLGNRYTEMAALWSGAIQALKAENDNLRACQQSWKCRLFGWR